MKEDQTIVNTVQASEERYHTLFDSNRDSITIFRIDADGTIGNFIEANPATTALFGYSKKELFSMNVLDLENISDTKRQKRIEKLQLQGKIDFETKIKNKKGNLRNVEIETSLINYLNEPAVMNITRDITERKQTENNIRKVQENLSTILEAIPDLLFEVGLDGKIHHYQAPRKDLLAVPPSMFMGKLFQDVLPPDVVKTCMEAIMEADKKGWSSGKQYAIDLPQGKHWFELSVSPIKEGNILDKHFIILARDITERKIAEISLAENKQNLQSVYDSVDEAIYVMNESGTFIDVNKGAEKMYQYSRQELIGKSPRDVAVPGLNDLDKIQKFSQKVYKTGKPISFEFWAKRKNGEIFPKDVVINKGKHSGQDVLIVTARDITERKVAEEKLKVEKERIRTILELVGSPIFLKDNDHRITYANSAFYKLFGLNEKNVIGKTLAENVPEDEKEHFLKIDRNVLDTGIPDIREEKLTVKGVEHTIITSKTRFKDAFGIKSLVGTIYDITERKKAESKLIANEHFLNQTQIIANLGSYSLNFTTGKWTSTTVLDNIFGIDANFDRTIEGWSSIVHPEWRTIMSDYLNNEVIGKKTIFNKEYKIIKIDSKEERWVHGMGEITFDIEGQPLQLIGSIQDISERKFAEEKLKLSSEKFQDLVNSTGGIVWEADAKTFNFTFVSEQAERLLGYTAKEWQSPNFWKNHLHPDDKEHTIEYCASYTKQMKAHDFIYRFRAKDGKYIWLRDIVNVVVEDGKPRWLRGVMFDITVQKENEESLRESEEKYRGLVENSPDAIVIYIDDKITFINDEGLRMVGAKNREEIIGKHVLQFVHPDSLADVNQYMEEVTRDQNASRIVEEKFIRLDGVPFYVEIKAIPAIYNHRNAIQVIVHDITERKRTEEKIRQLSQAVEQSPVSIIITNTKGEIEYANPKFVETTGYTLEEVIHQNPRVLKSGYSSPEEYKILWQTISAGKEWHGEFHNKKKDGSLYWESASISPIVNSEGSITHFIAIKEDITHRKNVEKQLIISKEHAEESDRLKLAFLANMSHEIRTPMNGILGFTELLKAPHLSGEEQREYIKIIEQSGKRMLNIINDIISISKVESGQIEVSLSETNVNEQIEYIHTFFKPEAKQKGIELSISKLLSPKETLIKTDREKVYAILTNLVKNALKFTNEGSIEFGCEKKGDYLEFYIKDTGLGISKSQKKIIFERFRQVSDTISRSHEGSGLGLAISKAYVEMLGGTIWVESEEGKGSTFYFTIPFHSENKTEEKISVKKTGSEVKEENKIKDLKVLIVEDDAISKLLITIAVKPYSKEIIKVSTGLEAVDACRNNPDIDLVMMDINMPEMGGYEATNLIREFNKDLVIIAQTANGMQSDRDNAIAAGCTDYISKPINITSLGELIQKYFKK